MNKKNILIVVGLTTLNSCILFKKTVAPVTDSPSINLDTVTISGSVESPEYQGSEKKINDLIHTKLDVRFDWGKAYLYGQATLTVRPHFYPTDSLLLDAKGFDIHRVELLSENPDDSLGWNPLKKTLEYKYDSNKTTLSIKLNRVYKKEEHYTVFIEYTAKPNELKQGGSTAITSDKGLYFINPEGKDKNKPQQIWTQGETQANSAWFPTIDRPNQKMTQEICITINKKFATLSNGQLIFSTENVDTTRTDCWKLELSHAPYLAMMAIGDYAVVKDKWQDKEVSYYVEKEYEPYARAIFGNTPEMMEYFSKQLGVTYPWNKYSQVVVRDYVSGAMENTTATVHGESIQQTDRELLDGDREDVIAHELFHQWFGNLVTCESWANLPLHESFATYGEYLWMEYKYGRDDADKHLQDDLNSYLMESLRKQVNMIRFYYNDREDMFDAHSYSKGGCILHMLRKYVGDEAFFNALKLYLETNKFTTVEIHQLRLAFEQVTGEDLNWFFNQWFLASGHPQLSIQHHYNDTSKKYTVTVSQIQNLKTTPLYQLPIEIDIYTGTKKERHHVVIKKKREEFIFDLPAKPKLVNVDAEKMLLCTKEEKKSLAEWMFQYYNGPLYLDRYEALIQLSKSGNNPIATEVIVSALNDKSSALQKIAIDNLKNIPAETRVLMKEKLIAMAENDKKSMIRERALAFLSDNFKEEELMPVYKKALNDKSYAVLGKALSAIAILNEQEALTLASRYENEKNNALLLIIADIYATHGAEENNEFFIKALNQFNGFSKVGFLSLYAAYLEKSSDRLIDSGLTIFENIARNEQNKWLRYFAQKSIKDFEDLYKEREENIVQKIKDLKSNKSNSTALKTVEEEHIQAQNQRKKVTDLYNSLIEEK